MACEHIKCSSSNINWHRLKDAHSGCPILVFRGLAYNIFQVRFYLFFKRKQTPLLNSKRLKITKNLIDFNFESEFHFSDFSADRKVFLLIQFLQFEFHFIKNVSIINCS